MTRIGAASSPNLSPPCLSPPKFGHQGTLLPRDVHRAGSAAANAPAKSAQGSKTFAELDARQQDRLLKGLETGDIKFDDILSKTFWSYLLRNTKEGYLCGPMYGGNKDADAWKPIGFLPARADFTDWVGRPGVAYPLPPVSINAPQAYGNKHGGNQETWCRYRAGRLWLDGRDHGHGRTAVELKVLAAQLCTGTASSGERGQKTCTSKAG